LITELAFVVGLAKVVFLCFFSADLFSFELDFEVSLLSVCLSPPSLSWGQCGQWWQVAFNSHESSLPFSNDRPLSLQVFCANATAEESGLKKFGRSGVNGRLLIFKERIVSNTKIESMMAYVDNRH
jgi:hypothetical protein